MKFNNNQYQTIQFLLKFYSYKYGKIWKNGSVCFLRVSQFSTSFLERQSSISIVSKSICSVFQQANSESALGKYAGGVAGAAGDAALFVANHAY